ncbi:MAG: extracellular solute-binding protein [Anaerolineae bacterium]|nr:extracellular solute-binding protein [Anaerolineae bacterium]
MKKTVWVLVALVVVAGLPVAGCARATPQPTPVPVPVEEKAPEPTAVPEAAGLKSTVTLWHAWNENEIESLNDVIAAFQAGNPGVQFDVLYVPFDELSGRFETAAAAGGGPALLIGAAGWGPAFYDAGLIADVGGMAGEAFRRTINPAALSAVRYKGALVGLPQAVKGVVMYRNKNIIAEAPATFEELVAAARAATVGDTVGADLEYGFFFAAAHLDGIGGALMDENGDPLFNDARGVEWLNLLNSFKEAGPTEYYTDNDVSLFRAGKAGIIIDATWNMAGLARAIGAQNLAIDPWPAYGDGHLSGYVQTENIYMSANAVGDAQAAAWAFMEFFLSPQAQALLADPAKAGHIPAVLGVEVADPLIAQAAAAFAGGVPFPLIPEMDAYWEPMDTALRSVLDEGADPTAALQRAFDSITAAIAEIRGR